jgi:hypothetical protein
MAVTPFPRRIQESVSIGNQYEKLIAPEFFADLGWSYAPSSEEQNWRDHFDYATSRNGTSKRVEVKAPKKFRGSFASSLILLEYTGITGMPGWLRGKADVILQFLSETQAICYSRRQILDAFVPLPCSIERFGSFNAPIKQWFGREGLSRKGLPNQDIIRWEPLNSFASHGYSLYQKGRKWEKQ